MKVRGNLARSRRLERGLTLQDVKEATGIDKSDLSKAERGKAHVLSARRTRALADFLGIPMHELAPEIAELQNGSTE